jgi:hypothetical protein
MYVHPMSELFNGEQDPAIFRNCQQWHQREGRNSISTQRSSRLKGEPVLHDIYTDAKSGTRSLIPRAETANDRVVMINHNDGVYAA